MANILRDSFINPLKTYDLDYTPLPQYQSRFQDDVPFVDTIKSWQQQLQFPIQYLKADAVRQQYETNYTPLEMKVYDCDGLLILTQNFDTKQQNFFDPDFYIRQIAIDLADFDYGCYRFDTVAGSLVLRSECVEVCEDLPDTYLLEYSHYERYQGMYFQAPFAPMLRVPAWLKYEKTAMKSTVYEDQPLNETMVKAIPYRIFKFIVGGKVGVPPWLIDKVSRIFGCNEVKIDGRYYTKAGDGAEFEPNELEGYPMSGWACEIREKYNRDGVIYESDIIVAGKNIAAAVIGAKGFGTNTDDYDNILDVE